MAPNFHFSLWAFDPVALGLQHYLVLLVTTTASKGLIEPDIFPIAEVTWGLRLYKSASFGF